MEITLEDIQEWGFVPYQYTGMDGVRNGSVMRYGVIQAEGRYVHASVSDSCRLKSENQKSHPIISYHPTKGWVGDWGAMQFPLNTWDRLVKFCNLFDYPIPQANDDTE